MAGFLSKEEWDNYINEWECLSNAQYQCSGEYFETFISCDAIINDSVSFMAEILYAHKPMLYLKSSKAAFNELGDMLEECHYSCAGSDHTKIEEFINMIIANKDEMYLQREEFFRQYLDYKNFNGITVSRFIYEYVKYSIA